MGQAPEAQQKGSGTSCRRFLKKDERWNGYQFVKYNIVFMFGFVLLFTSTAHAGDRKPLRLEQTIALSDVGGRIDHMAVDLVGERLFVAALGNNTVEVISLKLSRKVGRIKGLNEPQGVLYLDELKKLFVTNAGDGSCKAFDGITLDLLETIKFSSDADNIRYEPNTKQVYVGFGDGAIGAFDPRTGQHIWRITLAGHPESFQIEEIGTKIFVNVRPADQVEVIDRKKREIAAIWRLDNAKDNFPMAFDERNHRLFIGCRTPSKIVIYDTDSGKPVGTIDIAGDVDDIFYDLATKRLYASCGEGFLCVFQQIDPDQYLSMARIPTAKGARTSLFVPERRRLYLAVPHRGGQQAEVRVYTVD
jgi:WD40 repeat protein